MDQLVTPAELAKTLHTTPGALAQKRLHGDGIPFVKDGRKVLYRLSDVQKYLADNTFQSTAEAEGVA